MHKCCLTLSLLVAIVCTALSQGYIRREGQSRSIKGALNLLPGSTTMANGFQQAQTTFPDGDPLLNRKEWVTKGESKMRGLVGEAVLFFEWWTMLGDPVERYMFKWRTSGYYEVSYFDDGKHVTKTVRKSDLAKYPDLLKWFDNISPNNVNLEIVFANGELGDQEYNDFKNKYSIMGDLGSAGYKMEFRTDVDGANWLFERSDRDAPLVVPQIGLDGWHGFLGLSRDMDSDKKRKIVELFKLSGGASIKSFRVTAIDWDVESMVLLAKKYAKYEKGELSPRQITEEADQVKKSSNDDEFWDEPEVVLANMETYRDPTNSLMGLKVKDGKRALPAVYNELNEGRNGIFYGSRNGNLYAVNSLGKEIGSVQDGRWDKEGGFVYKSVKYSDECYRYYYVLKEVYQMEGNRLVKSPTLVYSIEYARRIALTIVDNSARKLTEAEKAAQESAAAEERRKCKESLSAYCEGIGAVPYDAYLKKAQQKK